MYKEFFKLNSEETTKQIEKRSRDINRHHVREDNTDGKALHKKMLHIICH